MHNLRCSFSLKLSTLSLNCDKSGITVLFMSDWEAGILSFNIAFISAYNSPCTSCITFFYYADNVLRLASNQVYSVFKKLKIVMASSLDIHTGINIKFLTLRIELTTI